MQAPQAPNQEQGMYGPDQIEPIVFEGFSGLNTNSSRPGIKDEECWWMDGFMPVGPNFARTMPGVGALLLSSSSPNIVFFDFFNIAATPYMFVSLSDGSITVVNTSTGMTTQIATAGTITNPSRSNVGISQWGSLYLIIVAVQTNGYFIWDGTTFYKAGDSLPGSVGGTMPTGISGFTVETYTSHVWVGNGATITFSAPSSVVDFSTNNGGGSFSSTDSFLRVQYTALRQTNGFLYLIGDSSINYISGVVTTGSGPATTTFTNQNADPEIGTPYGATIDVFSRNILFANAFGAHVSYGGAVTKVSDNLDGVYSSVPNFGGFNPSACKAIVYGKRIWAVLIPVIDFVTGQQVNKLFCWNGKTWWSTGQDINLTYVQHQEINSVITAYGTDGTNIYPLFQRPSVGFTKTLQSKLWAKPGGYQFQKTADRLFGLVQYFSLLSPAVTISVDNENGESLTTLTLGPTIVVITNDFGNTVTVTDNASGTVIVKSAGDGVVVFPPTAVGQVGVLLGFTAQTDCADMAFISMMVAPQIAGYRG